VREMAEWLACEYVTNAQLLAGDFASAVSDVLARKKPEAPRMDGAEVAAARILAAFA